MVRDLFVGSGLEMVTGWKTAPDSLNFREIKYCYEKKVTLVGIYLSFLTSLVVRYKINEWFKS